MIRVSFRKFFPEPSSIITFLILTLKVSYNIHNAEICRFLGFKNVLLYISIITCWWKTFTESLSEQVSNFISFCTTNIKLLLAKSIRIISKSFSVEISFHLLANKLKEVEMTFQQYEWSGIYYPPLKGTPPLTRLLIIQIVGLGFGAA